MSEKQNKHLWFPLRVTYARELKIKAALDSLGVNCFVPMQQEQRVVNGVKKLVKVPAIHNLIFVYASRETLDDIKLKFPDEIRYIMDRATGKPMVVPVKQMNDFIAVASCLDEGIIYMSLEESALKHGDRVRVIDGVFKGVEGKFVRIKRGLRVVVELNNLFAIATVSLHPSMVEKIQFNEA